MSAEAASNPNTPADELRELAQRYPAEVLHNPVLPLLLLDEPDWLDNLPTWSLRALLQQPAWPARLGAALVRAALPYDDLAPLLADHPAIPAAALARWQQHRRPELRQAGFQHPQAPKPANLPAAANQEWLEHLDLLAVRSFYEKGERPLRALLCLAGQADGWPAAALGWLQPLHRQLFPQTTFDTLLTQRLFHDAPLRQALYACFPGPAPDPTTQPLGAGLLASPSVLLTEALATALARQPDAPAAVLAHLAASAEANVRMVVAAHPNTPVAARQQLVHDAVPAVREALAQRPQLSGFMLGQLLTGSSSHKVRLAVAAHPNTPPELLTGLAEADTAAVPEAVARRPDAAPELLRQLAAHPHPTVRQAVAAHPHTPPDVLTALAHHPDTAVAAAANPATSAGVLIQLAAGPAAWAVAGNPAAPLPLLHQLARHRTANVRYWVGKNPATPPELLLELAARREDRLASALAPHPALPAVALPLLHQTGMADSLLAARPDLPADLREQLLTTADAAAQAVLVRNPALPPAVLAQWATLPARPVRRGVAENPATPPETLALLARDKEATVRAAAALHPALPPELLPALVADKAIEVLHALAQRPALAPELAAALRPQLLALVARKTPQLAALLTQLACPELLTPPQAQALVSSPAAAERLAAVLRPALRPQLRTDAHLLIRTVAAMPGEVV